MHKQQNIVRYERITEQFRPYLFGTDEQRETDEPALTSGTLSAFTTGGNEEGKPKAVTGITVSGGSFYAKVSKSWACDSGYGDDTTTDDKLANCVTVIGTPATNSIAKKQVQIIYC